MRLKRSKRWLALIALGWLAVVALGYLIGIAFASLMDEITCHVAGCP